MRIFSKAIFWIPRFNPGAGAPPAAAAPALPPALFAAQHQPFEKSSEFSPFPVAFFPVFCYCLSANDSYAGKRPAGAKKTEGGQDRHGNNHTKQSDRKRRRLEADAAVFLSHFFGNAVSAVLFHDRRGDPLAALSAKRLWPLSAGRILRSSTSWSISSSGSPPALRW